MNQIIVDILNLNEKMNFQVILTCLLIYLIIFWGAIATWVYFDARKRYDSKYLAFSITAAVFLFSFPALILYLVLRKESAEFHEEHPHYDIESINIPTIPVADLMDNGEIKFKLELSIVPVNSINSTVAQNTDLNEVKTDTIKIKLVEYMNKSLSVESEIDKRIKGQIHKLLGLIKKKNKQITT
jgi:hypothetical protein